MSGDGRTRFCSSCDKHVHDLSLMTRAEVAGLVSRTGGNFCGKLSRLPDGTLITSDLFAARAGAKSRAGRAAGAAITALLSLCANALAQTAPQTEAVKSTRPPYVLRRDDRPAARASGITSARGTIFDIQDAVIAGAEIILHEKDSDREYRAVTDDAGTYVFPSVEAGVYTFAASAPGFFMFRKPELRLRKGETAVLDVTLQVGTMGEIIPLPPETGAAGRAAARISNALTLPYRWVKKLGRD